MKGCLILLSLLLLPPQPKCMAMTARLLVTLAPAPTTKVHGHDGKASGAAFCYILSLSLFSS
jgi:hypothetical protein